MKIIIAGGKHEASYIIDMFINNKKTNKNLVVINDNEKIAQELSEAYKIPVIIGNPTKQFTLDEAEISGSDLFIALSENDYDNYVACIMAKNMYSCKKVICSVTNPLNVEIFKKLGIDSAISSSFLIGETIKNESNIEDVFKTLSLEDDLIKIIEINIKEKYQICNKALVDIEFPEEGTISAIYRKPHIIIPKGKTIIRDGDRLVVIATQNAENKIIKFVTK